MQNMKKLCTILALFSLLIGISACSLQQGNSGLRLEMNESRTYYCVIGASKGVSQHIVIPEEYRGYPVKEIADRAFDGCSNLESIVVPESVTIVGSSVFYDCNKLTSVSMPGVTLMDKDVFNGCRTIEDLTIPADFLRSAKSLPLKNITISCMNSQSISAAVFERHPSLQKVTILQGIENIESDAFAECTQLETVIFPEGLKSIGTLAFARCPNLSGVVLPSSLKHIYAAAFRNCTAIKEIVIPGSVEGITPATFYGCTALTRVTLEQGIGYIEGDDLGGDAFGECNIKEIYIPRSITHIAKGSFENTPLEKAIFENTKGWVIKNSAYSVIGKKITLSQSDMADAEYAANILLTMRGDYMHCSG